MDLHEIAKEIANAGDGGLRLRQGTVSAIAADGTLTVTIAGSTVPVSGVRAFTSAAPVVGSAVWLAVDGPLVIALGALGSRSGIVEAWGGSVASIPAGSLLCNGASYLRATYPALFAAIGTTWGAADGSHFSVPPADRFLVGAGSTYAAGATGGEATHVLTVGEIASHTHRKSTRYGVAGGTSADPTMSPVFASAYSTADAFTDPQGGNGAHNNMPPYAALPFIIWT